MISTTEESHEVKAIKQHISTIKSQISTTTNNVSSAKSNMDAAIAMYASLQSQLDVSKKELKDVEKLLVEAEQRAAVNNDDVNVEGGSNKRRKVSPPPQDDDTDTNNNNSAGVTAKRRRIVIIIMRMMKRLIKRTTTVIKRKVKKRTIMARLNRQKSIMHLLITITRRVVQIMLQVQVITKREHRIVPLLVKLQLLANLHLQIMLIK